MATRNEAYSGLEVVPSVNHNPNDKYTYNSADYSNLEHAASPPPSRFPEKQAFISTHNNDGLQSAVDVGNEQRQVTPAPSKSTKTKKKKLIIGGIVAGVIIIAAIVGGVCGALLSNNKSSNSSSNATNSSAPSSSSPTSIPTTNSSASMTGDATVYPYYDAPTVVSWGYPHMDVIITNDTQQPLWLSRYPNATSVNDWRTNRADANDGPFVYLTGAAYQYTHSIAAIARGGNNTDVFAIGSVERGLWSRYHPNSMIWNTPGWYAVDSGAPSRKVLYTAPGVASWSQGRVDVFALGQNGELWQFVYDESSGGWGKSWVGFGGNFKMIAPTVISWAQYRYDMFVVNQNGTLAYKYYDGAWSPSQQSNSFFDLGGQLTSRPFAITTGIGQIDVFARGGDAGLWHLAFDGSWGKWSRMGPSSMFIKGDPSVVVLGNTMHVFAWSDTNGLLHASFNWKQGNGSKAQFETVAVGLTGAPTAVADGVNVEVFAHVQNNRLGWKVLNGGTKWSPSDQTMAAVWQY